MSLRSLRLVFDLLFLVDRSIDLQPQAMKTTAKVVALQRDSCKGQPSGLV